VGHDAWTRAYSDPELYDWFLRHRRFENEFVSRRVLDLRLPRVKSLGDDDAPHKTGFIPGLWGDLAGRKKPIAVIAPYRRFQLPKRDALRHIGQHASKIMLTCDIDLASAPCPVRPPLNADFRRAK
jgi:hypothetical protein